MLITLYTMNMLIVQVYQMCSKARGIKEKNEVTNKTLNARFKGRRGAWMKVLGHGSYEDLEKLRCTWAFQLCVVYMCMWSCICCDVESR